MGDKEYFCLYMSSLSPFHNRLAADTFNSVPAQGEGTIRLAPNEELQSPKNVTLENFSNDLYMCIFFLYLRRHYPEAENAELRRKKSRTRTRGQLTKSRLITLVMH